MITLRKYTLLFLSLACYVYMSQEWFILYALLSIIVVITGKWKNTMAYMPYLAIASLLGGFLMIRSLSTIMLIGYSVFAFCGISFIVDQYKEKKEYSVIDILIYLFYFPKMLAGPIVRSTPFIQTLNTNNFSIPTAYKSIKIIIYALFLKFVVADSILNVSCNSLGVNLFVQSLTWGIQFYLDFYAYSLLAVGVSMLVGIDIPYNFDNPYSASSFRDFWKKWNITLTSWLKDYVYIPLGGSRLSSMRTYTNILSTFVVSAMWHGLTIPFAIWGICHGTLVCFERLFIGRIDNKIGHLLYRTLVVFAVIMLWQMFRLYDINEIGNYLHRLCRTTPIMGEVLVKGGIAIGFLTIIEWKKLQELIFKFNLTKQSIICEVSLLSILLAVLVLLPFNYTFDFFYLKF